MVTCRCPRQSTRFYRLTCWQTAVFLLTLFLFGCSQPTPDATQTAVLPTATSEPTQPTATTPPTTTPPAVPTTAPAETAVPLTLASRDLILESPRADSRAVVGQPLIVSGRAPSNNPVTLTLTSGGLTLATAEAVPDESTGRWTATLPLSHQLSGPAWLTAVIPNQTNGIALFLEADPNYQPSATEAYVRPFRPSFAETAVSGYPLYFAGEATNPINNSLTIGLLVGPHCTRFVAQQPITLQTGVSSSSISWNGLIILPRGLAGQQACAVVYTGDYGAGAWQGSLIPLNLLAPDAEQVERISLESSFGLAFLAGDWGRIAGTAINASDLLLEVRDPANEQLLVEGKTAVGEFGFWEISLPIPTDAPNIVNIDITILEEDVDPAYSYRTTANIIR